MVEKVTPSEERLRPGAPSGPPIEDAPDTLRHYQYEAVRRLTAFIVKGHKKLVLEMPTGAGKSLIVSALMYHLSQRFTCAVIATPLLTVKNAFRYSGKWKAHALSEPGTVSKLEFLFDDLWVLPRKGGDETRALKHHVRATEPKAFVMMTTQSTLRRHWEVLIPEDTSGRILVVDEAHHVEMEAGEAVNETAKVVQKWLDGGGTVLQVSATPWRGNGVELFPESEGWVYHRRSIARHATEMRMEFLIERCVIERCVLGRGDGVSALEGKSLPRSARDKSELAAGWVAKWVKDEKPKSVFIVPPSASRQWSGELTAALEAQGARVFDAVGAEAERQEKLDELLATERGLRNYTDSTVDVIIACRRFDEGTDWPLCSNVYNYGLPGAYYLVLQRWGRAFRNKGGFHGYPEQFKSVAKATFLLPECPYETALEYERKTGNAHLLVACFMEDFRTAAKYAVPFRQGGPRSVADVDQEQEGEISERVRANAALTAIKKELRAKGAGWSVAQWKKWIEGECPVEYRRAAKAVLGAKLRKRGVDLDRAVEDFGEFFDSIAEQYRDLTIVLFEPEVSALTAFTGETAGEINKRLLGEHTLRGVLSEETIKKAVLSHIARERKPPSSSTMASNRADVDFGFPVTWGAIHQWLKQNLNVTLPQLITRWGLLIQRSYSLPEIDEAVTRFRKEQGRFPRTKDGYASTYFDREVPSRKKALPGTYWKAVDQRLRQLTGNTLSGYYGGERHNTSRNYTLEQIRGWVLDYAGKHGGVGPTATIASSKEPLDASVYAGPGETWRKIQSWCKRVHGVLLSDLVVEALGTSRAGPPAGLEPLTLERVTEAYTKERPVRKERSMILNRSWESVWSWLADKHGIRKKQLHLSIFGPLAPRSCMCGSTELVRRAPPSCRACYQREWAKKGNSLATKRPDLAEEWHPRNTLDPAEVSYGSSTKVWWVCPKSKDHDYEQAIASRTTQGQGCPFCAGRRVSPTNSLSAKFPTIAAEWHPDNASTPDKVTYGSKRKVQWRCSEGHEWWALINQRTSCGSGCPICSGVVVTTATSLAGRYPDLAMQWHPTLNTALSPDHVFPGSNELVWWVCGVNTEHVWKAGICRRVGGTGCPKCARKAVGAAKTARHTPRQCPCGNGRPVEARGMCQTCYMRARREAKRLVGSK